uniref:Elongation of very long chain fatty acids protein n=1 Tax=Parascaris equorum TaxID=6256 RepID=A0A914RG47_PAREQ
LALNLWNTWLAIFSIIGSGVTTVSLFNEISSYTVYGQFFEGPSGYLSFLFCISKIAELGDTIILVLRKRPLIFLHWYHHVLTLNYGVLSLSEKTPYNTWIIWLNFTVHAIMYSYYLLRSMHFRIPAAIAQTITITQILQFIITVLILTHIAYLKVIGVHVDGTMSTYMFCGKKFNAEKEALKKNK